MTEHRDWQDPEHPGDRYARHHLIDWWDQTCLSNAHILVVGAGALGNEVLKNLALLGVGNMTVIDLDTIETSNLSRTVLFTEEDVGKSKAQVAARSSSALNPNVNVRPIVGDVELDVGIGELKTYDVVLGCVDSINARWAINRLCQSAGIPWVNAGITATAAEVALFTPMSGPCYECSMTEAMWSEFNRRYSCTQLLRSLPPRTVPTTAAIASLAAAIQTHEAVCVLHAFQGQGSLLPGQKLFISVRPYRLFVVDIQRSSDCPSHCVISPDCIVEGSPSATTLADLEAHLKERGDDARALMLPYEVLMGLECAGCGKKTSICMPVKRAAPHLAICECGARRTPITTHRVDVASPAARYPLKDLGIPPNSVLTVDVGTTARVIELQEASR